MGSRLFLSLTTQSMASQKSFCFVLHFETGFLSVTCFIDQASLKLTESTCLYLLSTGFKGTVLGTVFKDEERAKDGAQFVRCFPGTHGIPMFSLEYHINYVLLIIPALRR